jgi:hypothetical protein
MVSNIADSYDHDTELKDLELMTLVESLYVQANPTLSMKDV